MPAIRCENCKGKGQIEQDIKGSARYTTTGIIGHPLGNSTFRGIANCPVCGGSGCRWEEEND